MAMIRAVFEPQPNERWRAYFFISEPRPISLGHTEGSWGHCMGELLWLREELAKRVKRDKPRP
jgi:hypothetical protein